MQKPLIRSAVDTVSTANRLLPNQVLFWQDERLDQTYEVVEGCLRAVHLQRNGGRQILAFFWPGDVIVPCRRSVQFYTAEAVSACTLRATKPQLGATGDEPDLVLDETLALLEAISQRGSLSRVAWCLLRMQPHLPATHAFKEAFRFVVPRKDIADHVGTSLETVCRSLTELKERDIIDLPNRKTIRFRRLGELRRVANGAAARGRRTGGPSAGPGLGGAPLAPFPADGLHVSVPAGIDP